MYLGKIVGEKNSVQWDYWVAYDLVRRLHPRLRAASNKMVWCYVVMRFINANLGFLLDTSGGNIGLY